jgi:hypothetical protein
LALMIQFAAEELRDLDDKEKILDF